MILSQFLERLPDAVQRGDQWKACCPAHDDNNASLSVSEGRTGKVVLHCFAGCTFDAIKSALGFGESDGANSHTRNPDAARKTQEWKEVPGTRKTVNTYGYRDEKEAVLYQVVREEYSVSNGEGKTRRAKTFKQRRPALQKELLHGNGGYIYSLTDARRVPFRLPEVLKAIRQGKRIYWPEGEKDVLNLVRAGLEATTTAQGASGYLPAYDYSTHFRGADIVLLPDNDDAGRKYAQTVAASLYGVAASVRILELPGLPEKGDVSDYLNAGGTAQQIEALADAAPIYAPAHKAELPPRETAAVSSVLSVPVKASTPELPAFDSPPRPLTQELLPVPAFDIELLPESLRAWALDIGQRIGCPIEFVAAPALIALSVAVGRRVAIRPKKYDDWEVTPNLWGAIVGQPGTLKTPAVAEAFKVLYRLEADARRENKDALELHEADCLIAKAKGVAATAALGKAAKEGASPEELRSLAMEAKAATPEPPARTRFTVNDATVEKLGEILRDNPNGVLVHRDELTGFFRGLDKPGHESDRAFYLEAWNGSGSFVYDRIGRGTVDIEAACVSLFGTIQPGPITAYLRGAATGEEADGFASRLQILVYPDPPRQFRAADRYPDKEAKARAAETFRRLSALTAESAGAQTEDEGIPFLRFNADAQEFFNDWLTGLENRLHSGDESALMQMHLSKYRSLIPSLALLLHLADSGSGSVTGEAARRAIAWAGFLESHARRLYYAAQEGETQKAQSLADRIKAGKLPNPFTSREVSRKGWNGFATSEDADRACYLLEERHWIQGVEVSPTDRGGRPSTLWHIHPLIAEKNLTNAIPTTDKTDKTLSGGGFVGFVSTSPGDCGKSSPAEAFLKDLLKDGPVLPRDIQTAYLRAGFTADEIDTASDALRVEAIEYETGGEKFLQLPGEDEGQFTDDYLSDPFAE